MRLELFNFIILWKCLVCVRKFIWHDFLYIPCYIFIPYDLMATIAGWGNMHNERENIVIYSHE